MNLIIYGHGFKYKDSTIVFYIFSLLGAFPLFPITCVIWELSMKSCVAYRLVSNFAIPTTHTHNITYMHTFKPPMLVRLQTHYIYEMYESKNTLLCMFVKLSQCFPKLQNLPNVKWLLLSSNTYPHHFKKLTPIIVDHKHITSAPQDEYKLYRIATMFPNPTKIKHFKWWPKDAFTNIKGTQILTKSCKSKNFKWWFEDGFTNIKGTHIFT